MCLTFALNRVRCAFLRRESQTVAEYAAFAGRIPLLIDTSDPAEWKFAPTLTASGDYVPSVEWFLSQLGVKPALFAEISHQYMAGSAEQIVNMSWDLSVLIDALFD